MREEWNKGYEKGRDDYCCNGDCNQGRDCPLRNKNLTDEEILKLYVNNSTYDNEQKLFLDIYGFARAILRKASEK